MRANDSVHRLNCVAAGIAKAMTAPICLAVAVVSLMAATANADSYAQMRYNQVRQKMIHNAMSSEEPILDMIIYHDVRVFEFDIHNGKMRSGSTQTLKGDWWFYHSGDLPNENAEHSGETLSDALKEVQTFHRSNPLHEVFTFYIDQHDDFEKERSPEDLDALIDRFFKFDPNLAKSELFTPFHLMRSGDPDINPVPGGWRCPCLTLQGCVHGDISVKPNPACRWPLLSTLRGKIIFVVTGGDEHADEYVGFDPSKCRGPIANCESHSLVRRAFATYDHSEVTSKHYDPIVNPNGFDRRPWEVFFNQEHGDSGKVFTKDCSNWPDDCNKAMQRIILDKHMIGRSYGTNSKEDWDSQVKLGVQLIGTDRVNDAHNAYPYASTHGKNGFPFQCGLTPGKACGTTAELRQTPIFNFTVKTDDMNNGGDPDSIAFAEHRDKSDTDYSVEVLVPSSWTEDWAKGCLMARSNRGAKAAYFAVCRPANTHRLQVQWRKSNDVDAKAAGYDDDVDIDAQLEPAVRSVTHGDYSGSGIPKEESISFLKFTSSNHSRTFKAFASRDDVQWFQIGHTETFDQPLVFKGISATSHGSNNVLWRFQRFRVGDKFKDAADGSWDYWLIGDGGAPSHAACGNDGCTFAHGDGNASFFLFRSGWGG